VGFDGGAGVYGISKGHATKRQIGFTLERQKEVGVAEGRQTFFPGR